MKIPSRIRYINKKYINRVMIKIAGKAHSPIALIRHRGRKSGNVYETPIIAAKNPTHFVFALTYGREVDWYRNVLAQRGGELLWCGRWYVISAPHLIDAQEAVKTFPKPAALILGLMKLEYFFQMEIKEDQTQSFGASSIK